MIRVISFGYATPDSLYQASILSWHRLNAFCTNQIFINEKKDLIEALNNMLPANVTAYCFSEFEDYVSQLKFYYWEDISQLRKALSEWKIEAILDNGINLNVLNLPSLEQYFRGVLHLDCLYTFPDSSQEYLLYAKLQACPENGKYLVKQMIDNHLHRCKILLKILHQQSILLLSQ